LREDIFPLQIERLLLPLALRAVLFGDAAVLFAHKTFVGIDLGLLEGLCHLFLQGYTFLKYEALSSILRGFGRVVTPILKMVTPEAGRMEHARLADFVVWH
jgi:hypothetical protein